MIVFCVGFEGRREESCACTKEREREGDSGGSEEEASETRRLKEGKRPAKDLISELFFLLFQTENGLQRRLH